nr:MAG TPA: hypothetical protein [Caudoviricetes sp.]
MYIIYRHKNYRLGFSPVSFYPFLYMFIDLLYMR